jgi:outer membrane protein assembly factor BamB
MLYRKLFAVIVTLLIFTMLPPVFADSAIWSMFKGNAQHTGQSVYNGSEENTVRWIFPTGERITSSPAIGSDGTIYVGSYDSYLYAINPDGTLKWKFKAEQIIDSSPAIGADGTIYFGSWDQSLYAVRPDGKGIWKVQTHGRISSSPAIGQDGTIYFGSDDGFLYALTPKGALKWSFKTGERIFSTPAVAGDGMVYIGSFDNNTYAINPDGTLKWKFPAAAFIFSSPTVGPDGTVYVGSYDSYLYAINPDGTLKWKFAAGGIVQTTPTIGKDGTIYTGSFDRKLHAINPDGTEKWGFSTDDLVVSSPVIDADGTLYFGSVDNNTYAVNPDGTEKWRFATNARIFSSPAIDPDGTVYVGSVDGSLYAIGKPVQGTVSFPVRGMMKESVGYLGAQLYVVDTVESSGKVDVTIIMRNYGSSRAFDPGDFALKDLDGKEYRPDQMESTLKAVKLQQGDTVRGVLRFEIPRGASPYMLLYRDEFGIMLGVDLTGVKQSPEEEPESIFRTGSNAGKKLIGNNIELTVVDEKFQNSQYIATLSIKNLGIEPLKYDYTYAYIKDSMGNAYTPDEGFSGELDAGETGTGQVVFTIPSSVDSVMFVYDDASTDSYFAVSEFPLSTVIMVISILMVLLGFAKTKLKILLTSASALAARIPVLSGLPLQLEPLHKVDLVPHSGDGARSRSGLQFWRLSSYLTSLC